jgi:hypothetical protein
VHLPHITHVLSLLLGGSCLTVVAADLVRHKKVTRREIGLSLAFGAAFTAIGLLGLLGHLASEWIRVSFTAVMVIMCIVEVAGRFYPRGVRGSTSRLFILCVLFFFLDAYYSILTIYLQG